MRSYPTSRIARRALGVGVLAALTAASACADNVHVASTAADTTATRHLKTFIVMAPPPRVSSAAGAVTDGDGNAATAVMDLDPMLETSLIGRAIRQDLANAFEHRGYRLASGQPDFFVAYYAGTGDVVDTRAHAYGYHAQGTEIDRETVEYPAGTIVVDVVDARTDTRVWRGTGVAEIPGRPDDYARTVRRVVDAVVGQYPRAAR